MATFQLLLSLLSFVSAISGQCSVDTCTKKCIPNQWERDLCLYYQEISTWHNSAVQCGLNVDPIPKSGQQSSPEELWEQARQYWEHLRAVWTEAATENGVFGSQDDLPSMTTTAPTTTTTTTTFEMLTPFSTEMEDMGSGFTSGLNSGIQEIPEMPTDPATEITTTSPPPPSNVQTQQEMWLSSVRSWENDFAQWESFTRSESGLRLPESVSEDIVGRLVTESGANNERANSATWFELLTDWNEGFSVYNTTFSGSCPEQ